MGFRTVAVTLKKELLLWKADPRVFLGGMVAPLAVLLAFYLLFGRPVAIPLAVVNHDGGAVAGELVDMLSHMKSAWGGRYFATRTGSREEMEALYRGRKVSAVLTIPAGFTAAWSEAEEPPTLGLAIDNVNTDLAKNVRLYLDQALATLYNRHYSDLVLHVEGHYLSERRVSWIQDIGVGLIVFSAMLAGAFNGFSSFLREIETGAIMELRLSPRPVVLLVTGKLIAAVLAGLASAGVMAAAVALLGGFRGGAWSALPLLVLIALILAHACFGLMVGMLTRHFAASGFIAVLTSLVAWLLGGGLGGIRMASPVGRAVAAVFPSTPSLRLLRGLTVWGAAPSIAVDFAHLLLSAGLLAGAMLWAVGGRLRTLA